MKKFLILLVAAVGAMAAQPCYGKNDNKIISGNPKIIDTLSYAIGANIGGNVAAQFSQMGLSDINIEKIKDGLKDGMLKKSKLTADDARALLQEFFSKTLETRKAEFDAKKEADSTAVFVPFVDQAENDQIAYALGVNIGESVREDKLPIQYYWLLKAFDDAKAAQLELNENQMGAFMQNYFNEVRPAEAKARAEKWLSKKARKSGVKKTESGLLYKVIEEGDMTQVATDDADIVTVNYVAKNMDGEVFEANRLEDYPEDFKKMIREQRPELFDENGKLKREEEPVKIPLNRIFKGFAEGVKFVGVGGKVKLYIPAELAFGPRGNRDGKVGPNEAIEFDIEVVGVVLSSAAAERSANWLSAKSQEPGVQKTESGLLYSIVESGNLKKAAKNDNDEVEVYYVGKLQDGTVFDSCKAEDKKPIKFPLNNVIKGWTEGMKLVGPGGKIKLYIPSELAYGATGAGDKIGPNEALEFEVELVSVTPAKKEQPKKK